MSANVTATAVAADATASANNAASAGATVNGQKGSRANLHCSQTSWAAYKAQQLVHCPPLLSRALASESLRPGSIANASPRLPHPMRPPSWSRAPASESLRCSSIANAPP